MKAKDNNLRLDSHILSAPLYTAGTDIETVQERYGLEEVIKLAFNENPLGPSPLALAAIQKALPDIFRYPEVADETLRERLTDHLGQGLTPENFVTGNGGCDVLGMIGRGFVREGDEVIISPPTFLLYKILAEANGGRVVRVPLEGEAYAWNPTGVLAVIGPQTRLVVLCNPNNPTGGIVTQAELETFMAQVPPSVVVLLDEAYQDFVTATDFPQTLGYVVEDRPVIVLRTFSKIYGLAGLRIGYAIAPERIARYLRRLRLPFHVPSLTLAAALAALDDHEHVAHTVALVAREREFIQDRLAALGIRYVPTQANYIAFDPGVDAELLCEELMTQGVIIRPLASFDMPTHARVSVGRREENERFLTTLERTLDRFRELDKE